MRWLARLFRSVEPLQPRPPDFREERLWIRTGFRAGAWDGERSRVRLPGEAEARLVPQDLTDFALSCDRSLTWEEHRENFARLTGIRPGDLGSELAGPEVLAGWGLVEEVGLVQKRLLGDAMPEARLNLERAAFLDRGREGAVRRSLESFINHLRANGRRMEAWVIGDGPGMNWDDDARECDGIGVRVFDMESRVRMAEWVAERAGVDARTVRWGLGGESGGLGCGSGDNFLLLMGAGGAFLRTAGGVEFEVHDLEPRPGHLVVGGDWDPYQYRAGIDLAREVKADYVGEHERLLGRHVRRVIGEQVQLEFAGVGEMEWARLIHPDASVRLTLAGNYGNAGNAPQWIYPWLNGTSAPGLWHHTPSHEALMSAGFLNRCVRSGALTGPPRLMGGAMAVDARELMPPWVPGLVGGEVVFARGVWEFRQEAWIGHVPVALADLDEAGRGKVVDGARPLVLHPLQIWEKLTACCAAPGHVSEACRRMMWTGEMMVSMASQAERFRGVLHDGMVAVLAERMEILMRWRQATKLPVHQVLLEQWLERLEQAAARPMDWVPGVGSQVPGSAEAVEAWRHLVLRHGQLLRVWPALWAAASAVAVEEKVVRFRRGAGS